MTNRKHDQSGTQSERFTPSQAGSNRPPIAISYRPKPNDYLPVVVASIRRHLGDWPIALLTEEEHLPPVPWLEQNQVQTITNWSHSPKANKVLRLWEHQTVFSRHFDQWIWWHDDMVLLRPLDDPAATFSKPLIAKRQRRRPNKELGNWHSWLWDTLTFFRCQNIYAPNPVLHLPRLIEREGLTNIPEHWNRSRLLFEPTYLLWNWHQAGTQPILASDERHAVFNGDVPDLSSLERNAQSVILTFGKKINHETTREAFRRHYPLDFTPLPQKDFGWIPVNGDCQEWKLPTLPKEHRLSGPAKLGSGSLVTM